MKNEGSKRSKPVSGIDWEKFTHDVVTLLENLGCSCLTKDELQQ